MLKKGLWLCTKVFVSAGLIAYVLHRVGVARALSQIRSAQPEFLGLGVLLFLASNLLGAYQWGLLLRVQQIRLPYKTVLSLYLVGVFFNNFMISSVGGDVIRVYDVRKIAKDGSTAFAATFLDRFIGLFSLICFSVVAYVAAGTLSRSSWVGVVIALLALILLATGAAMLSNRVGSLVEGVVLRLVPSSVGVRVSKVRRSFYMYRSHLGALGMAWVVSIGVQLLRVGLHYAAGLSLGVGAGFRYFLVFVPLIAMAASIPISFGGIGVRENFGVLLFQRIGVSSTTAFSMELLAYLLGLIGSVAGGLIFVFRPALRPGTPEVGVPAVRRQREQAV